MDENPRFIERGINIDPPMNQETTKVINYLYSSALPRPIYQISIIILKDCSIIRTMITKIIAYCWEHQYFPIKWKNGVTDLAYKSGSTSDPGNFRTITRQPVMSKIFNTIIKNRIYDYLLKQSLQWISNIHCY